MSRTNLHGTAVRLGDLGILIRGPSRSGKSALALSALRRAEGLGLSAGLVSDDQVMVRCAGGQVLVDAPASIAGMIEVSGVGIVRETAAGETALSLVVDLADPELIDRLPDEASADIAGVPVRRVLLPRREAAFGADVLVSLACNAALDPSAGTTK